MWCDVGDNDAFEWFGRNIRRSIMAKQVTRTVSPDVVKVEGRSAKSVDAVLDAARERILTLVKRTVESYVEIGRRLMEAKGVCPVGRWGKWLAGMGLKDAAAQKYIAISKAFGQMYEGGVSRSKVPLLEMGQREAYFVARQVLAAPDAAARKAVVERSITGKKVERAVVSAARAKRRSDRLAGRDDGVRGAPRKPADLGVEVKNIERSVGVFEGLVESFGGLTTIARGALAHDLMACETRIAKIVGALRGARATIEGKATAVTKTPVAVKAPVAVVKKPADDSAAA
jgi:hypothetical protein